MNKHAPCSALDACCVVACGTLRREIRHLAQRGFLDPRRVLFTPPGLHEWPDRLKDYLTRQLERARAIADNVVVVYGEKCYLDANAGVDTDAFLASFGNRFARVRAKNCVDMLADVRTREDMAGGAKVYWLTPGWLQSWDFIFKDWDRAMANETFPAHDKAIILDAIGYFDQLSETDPEKILRIGDWTRLPLEPHRVSLGRLERLLCECARQLECHNGRNHR